MINAVGYAARHSFSRLKRFGFHPCAARTTRSSLKPGLES
jgi:hypothetical protein